MRRLIFLVGRDPYEDYYHLRIGIRDEERGTLAIAQPIQFTDVPEGELAPDTAALKMWDGQGGQAPLVSLMDQLWALGIRPSDIGTPGHLAATQAHLADMRRIVEGALKLKFEEKPAKARGAV